MATTLSPEEDTRLRQALDAVCGEAGLDPTGAKLIKYTMNAVFRLDSEGVVVRIAIGPGAAARVDRVVRVAAVFADRAVPTVRLASGLERPVFADGWSASIWALLPQPAYRAWAPADLAVPLRAIHAMSDLPEMLPAWDPVAKSRRRLADLAHLDEDQQQYMCNWADSVGEPLDTILERLSRWCDDLDVVLEQIDWQLPPGVIHGDAHTGNLLVDQDGLTVMCDLDSVAIGPREWDLTPAAHGPRRFGRDPAKYAAFARDYGIDVTTLPGWDVLRQIRELQLVTSVIASLPGRPAVADELAHRLFTIFAGDLRAVWRRYQ